VSLRHLAPLLAALAAPLSVPAQTRSAAPSAGAEIVFLDVGQGDAILIRSDTFNALIDAGKATWTLYLLDSLHVKSIHLAIVSHNHKDHIGAMDLVIRDLLRGPDIDNGCWLDSEQQARVARPKNRGSTGLGYHLYLRWDVFESLSISILPAILRLVPEQPECRGAGPGWSLRSIGCVSLRDPSLRSG
jgi:hypothetical protein